MSTQELDGMPPTAVIAEIRMPRTHAGEGVAAAALVRDERPRAGVDGPSMGEVERPKPRRELDWLTTREREVLAAMAAGESNSAIAARLFVSPKTIETHVGRIFMKLGLSGESNISRRVVAVLAWLDNQPARPVPGCNALWVRVVDDHADCAVLRRRLSPFMEDTE